MQIEQRLWTPSTGWTQSTPGELGRCPDLVLVFGERAALGDARALGAVRERYRGAPLTGCSTAGEIAGSEVLDGSLVATALCFSHTSVRVAHHPVDGTGSYEAARRLGKELLGPGLSHVFVLSEGLHVNGSDLVRGFADALPPHVGVTGGLSGDGAKFEHTVVLVDGLAREGVVVAIGFYGDRLRVGYGSQGGWDQFGPARVITRSEGSVLFELDGEPALEVYRRYLGEHADGLPASGLLFPLSILERGQERELVRTVLAVDQEANTMTFAGDMPRGARARLMRANFERLIDGAVEAADATSDQSLSMGAPALEPEFAILISCVGRKLILGQRTDEEVAGVRTSLGDKPLLTGFYSYGEISPFTPHARCELHNQTMTVTTFAEM